MQPAFLHLPGDRLSGAELSAARLDGHVVELGEAYAPADLVETGALRAASLAPLIAAMPEAAFAGMSAAWIHGAGDAPPHLHEVQSAVGRRLRAPASRRILVHDPALDPEDLVRIGGAAVTAPERTLIDLVRWPTTVPERWDWARALVLMDPDLAARAERRLLAGPRGPGFRRAAQFLAEATAARGADEPQGVRTR
ncbi:type IV toxin-antitoxin system AbiEi family antitoxin [Microbacterium sp. ASV81]|uniref:Type IV toxin-antitoxin system AbiEi family antitoxin n=1 Tax=Microbacterium capsulatum TaxID=3041921 RepID=A0ABU0XCB6_9MICO|nr:type IV toxin-antitoxin system AbiEi family antitoxin [Microbacterium sp. ASV81]MDQ4212756.1 type IV toxin-antitoxin system AbiEi family antitoxin [Microbacterium sp. ASV81]